MIFLGAAYLVSQMIIARILEPIGRETFLKLQLCFSEPFYLDTFRAWEATGQMAAYRAHFFMDAFHPVWYTLFLISLLGWVLNSRGLSDRWNWMLILPIAAGLSDELENLMQGFFLSGIGITQPLVILSSMFSLAKWTLAFISLGLFFAVFLARKKA